MNSKSNNILKRTNRNISIDLIRTIAIMLVLIIHTTSNYYVTSYNSKGFLLILIISSLTCSAVPLFYMLSGAFLINEKNSNYKTFYKKPLKIFLQTIFWTLIYLLIYKFYFNQNICLRISMLKAFFTEQVGHLWYMYPLIALYVMCPFITKLYYQLTDREKKELILITFLFPALICTIQMKYWDIVSIPKFAIMFPELGLFLLGKYLYDKKEKFENRKVSMISFVGILIGLTLIMTTAIFHIKGNGISNSKPYFDANKLTVILLISSIFIFISSIQKNIEKMPNIIKKFIWYIGTNTGGIYFIHMIFIQVWPDISIFGLHATQNTGRLVNMLFGAIIYLILSIISIFVIKLIPVLRKSVS